MFPFSLSLFLCCGVVLHFDLKKKLIWIVYATCSCPLAASWFFITSGKSGGEEYGVISRVSNSPVSDLKYVNCEVNVKHYFKILGVFLILNMDYTKIVINIWLIEVLQEIN